MKFLLFLLLAIPTYADITGLSVVTATSGQIVISYTAASTASCKVEVSKESDYTPLATDVDATLYTSQDRDTSRTSTLNYGRHRIVVLGRLGFAKNLEAVETALNGYNLSRALQADTQYYIRVSDCGDGDSETIQARTTNIRLGDSRGTPLAVASPWKYRQVATNKVANPEFADPYTGALIKNPASIMGFSYSQSTATSGDGYSPSGCNITTLTGVNGACRFTDAVGTGWTATTGTVTDAIQSNDDNFAEYSGTSQDRLYLRLGTGKFPTHSTLGGTLSFQNLAFSAKTSDTAGDGEFLMTCLSGRRKECLSPERRITLTTTEAAYSVCNDSPCMVKDNPGDTMLNYNPGLIPGLSRVYNLAGSLTTLRFAGTNASAACNELVVGETIYAYDTRTNGTNPTGLIVNAKSCGSSPPQITIHDSYDFTHNGTTGVTFWLNDGLASAGYGILVWKESTTSNSTVSVDLALWRAATTPNWILNMGSGGFGKRCQNVPTAGGYYLCMTGSDANMIIGVKPTTDGLDIVSYGLAGWRGDLVNAALANTGYLTGSSAAANDAMWDDELPGVFYMYFVTAGGCGQGIVKMTLSLATPAAAVVDGSGYPGGTRTPAAGLSSAVLLTPCGSGASDYSLVKQRENVSAGYASLKTSFTSCAIESVQGRTLIEVCKAGQQDSHGFVFAYDLGNRLAPGSGFVGTRGGNTQQAFGGFLVPGNAAARWCGTHTVQNPLSAAGSPFVMLELGAKAPMGVTGNTNLSPCDSRSTPGTCSACPDVTLNGFNYSGRNWCSTIDITSSCASVNAPAGCVDGDPISGGDELSPNLKWYQPIAVGDILKRSSEYVRVVQKISQTQIVVHRGWGYASNNSSFSSYAPISHSAGSTWATNCGGFVLHPATTNPEQPFGLAWYFGDSPDGSNPTYAFLNKFQNHGFHSVNFGAFPDYTVGRFDLSDAAANAASLNTGSYVQLPNRFAGKDSNCFGNSCEKHPGANQVLGDTSWFVDVNPRMFHASGTNGVALASGKSFIYEYTGDADVSPKHYDLEGYMGKYPMLRVDTLSDSASDTGKWCVAIVANDCFSGSTAGKAYLVNELFDTTFIPLSTCRESQFGTVNGDMCFGPTNGVGASVAQWKVPAANGLSIPNGSQARATSREWRFYREAATENTKADPTGTALMMRGHWYVAPPPMANQDTVNRATFIPLPVPVTAVTGADNALVEFGYNPSFQCSQNRDETCYAEGASVNITTPFKFSHETLTGLACSSGCTVVIPAIAGKIVYGRVKIRNSGGTVIYTGPTQVW